MVLFVVLFLATCFLAYANGSNDNFKGVATLFGSGTTNYRYALFWATFTTFAGAVSSIFLAEALLKHFSGKGLVPDAVAASPEFLIAVAIGAGLTVILATVTGFPVSTTHSLTGTLVGAGVVAVGTGVDFSVLGNNFFLPLLVSPVAAVGLAALAYFLFRFLRTYLGIGKEWCLCIGGVEKTVPIPQPGGAVAAQSIYSTEIALASEPDCVQRYTGRMWGVRIQTLLDWMHYLSAGVVSFARGLNDTPKIVAILLAANAFHIEFSMFAVAAAMAIGGLLSGRKVAQTMGKKIVTLNHGQGFSANLVTGLLVIVASRFGMPVSTTHVSVGSLMGIGLVSRKWNPRVMGQILASWLLTLPIAACLGGLIYWSLH